MERVTLARIRAPAEVRLACQTRPIADVAVAPLVPAAAQSGGQRIAFEQGQEHTVTALAVDLRDSTQLAAERLPFDTLYLVNRYISRVTAAIEQKGGYVTSVAGDGMMSVFGVDGRAAEGARNALAAALGVWDAVAALEGELAEELHAPLRFGVGVHTGEAVVGAIVLSGRSSLQFLGDTGNVAARLEALAKERGCVLFASATTLAAAGLAAPAGATRDVLTLRGREKLALAVVGIAERAQLAAILMSAADAAAPARGA
jgi:adenylate cyclase